VPSATLASLAMSEILALKKPFFAKTFVAARIILLCLLADFITWSLKEDFYRKNE
jgi:hypothetical protein